MTLSDLSIGKVAIVDQISLGYHGQGLITRLEAMGITPDKPIRVLRKAWLGGPLHIRVGITTEIAIRRREAEKVLIRMEG
ncbi:MAG: FeoA family protein [Snowella sp.]|nr:FeoA family protein [Snowella sp.]